MPILEGLDGVEKMSKSLGNYVSIQETAKSMFGKIMSISDPLMFRYYELLTDRSPADIEKMRLDVERGREHPLNLKRDLAEQIVSDFHGAGAARKAAEDFAREFQRGEIPESMAEFSFQTSSIALADVLTGALLADSKSEARRLIKSGAVLINREKVSNVALKLTDGQYVIRCGKLRWARVNIGQGRSSG
jgi:tyrosyl-tRNA synthetase